jgi:hypothetical protein
MRATHPAPIPLQAGISHASHLGGLLCGLAPALLLLPRLGSERWEAAAPALGGLALAVWFSVLPAWVYAARLPGLGGACGEGGGGAGGGGGAAGS